MALVNRDKDASEQKDVYQYVSNFVGSTTVSTGATGWIAMMPYPGVIQSARLGAQGLSGAMQVALQVLRFASGGTTIAVSISNMVCFASGLSGVQGYSGLAATGSTLLNLQAGDILQFETSVANTAARVLLLEVVVKKSQDIVSYNGIST